MDASHQELLDIYKIIKEALEKEKPKRLRLQEWMKKLEKNIVDSKATNADLAKDLEAKEEKFMSLNKLLRHEQLNSVAHEKTIMKQNLEIRILKDSLSELVDTKRNIEKK